MVPLRATARLQQDHRAKWMDNPKNRQRRESMGSWQKKAYNIYRIQVTRGHLHQPWSTCFVPKSPIHIISSHHTNTEHHLPQSFCTNRNQSTSWSMDKAEGLVNQGLQTLQLHREFQEREPKSSTTLGYTGQEGSCIEPNFRYANRAPSLIGKADPQTVYSSSVKPENTTQL